MEKIVIIGGGGHAKVVLDILIKINKYEIEGIIVDKINEKAELRGIPVFLGDSKLDYFFNSGIHKVAIGIGGYRDNKLRMNIFNLLKKKNFEPINVIDPSAIISETVKFGEGNVVFPGVVLNTGVILGNNNIIATGATIDHETIIEDNVLISAGVTVGAYSRIKDGALIALGAKIISGVEIGSSSLVAAGAVVTQNIKPLETVYGIPARPKNQG